MKALVKLDCVLAGSNSFVHHGNFYICLIANTNVAPAPTGSTDWILLGTSNTLIGAYSGATAYIAGNQVTNAGFIFQALQATTGNAPPTPPATSAFWILVGPASIDPSTSYVLAKGSTPLTQNTGLSYTSTTSAIDLIWEALALYRADGTITTIGSSSQNVTGLGSGPTFYAYPAYNESSATFKFISNSDVSFPTLKGIGYTNAGNEDATTTTSAALRLHFRSRSGFKLLPVMQARVASPSTPAIQPCPFIHQLRAEFRVEQWDYPSRLRDSGGHFYFSEHQTYNDGEFHHVCYTCNPSASNNSCT